MSKKILIVEDDFWIANWLKLYLWNSWFNIDTIFDWENAVEKILSWIYDLIILDINLPKKDWITICKEVREKSNIPIIMLTARNQEFDRIKWLEIWADDYVSKPFSPRELLARINSIFRRIEINNENKKIKKEDILEFQDIKINLSKKTVYKKDKVINLTKNEFDILKKIFQENWKIVKRETLMKEIIWYENYIFDRTIDTHIKNLRKKLNSKDIILTVRWIWYRLNK